MEIVPELASLGSEKIPFMQFLPVDTLLVMKYIRKKKEIDYFGVSINGKVYIDFNDEISRFPDGAYGYYGPFMRCKNDETYQPQGPETHPRPPSVSSPRQTPGTVLASLR